MGKVNLSFW